MSRRPSQFNKKRNILVNNDFYEDIYYTSYKNGKWYTPALFPKPINTKGNEAISAVNTAGSQMIIRRGLGKGTFFITHKKSNGKWSRPKQAIRKINKKNSFETTLTFSHDSNTVYFVSNRRKGFGRKDIWITHKKETGGWSKPKNLGQVINTPLDEEGVFISENDSVLYFSSKRTQHHRRL